MCVIYSNVCSEHIAPKLQHGRSNMHNITRNNKQNKENKIHIRTLHKNAQGTSLGNTTKESSAESLGNDGFSKVLLANLANFG